MKIDAILKKVKRELCLAGSKRCQRVWAEGNDDDSKGENDSRLCLARSKRSQGG